MTESRAGSAGRRRITGITAAALFAALIAGGAFVSVPLPFSPVPVVLQNLFAVLAGLVLGPAGGAAAAALFLAAGALGAPVFAGASGGAAHFAGPTGGFLAGYFLAALAAGLAAGRPRPGRELPRWRLVLGTAAGFLIIYAPGLLRLRYAVGSWPAALGMGFFPFIAGDAAKAVLAALSAGRLRRALADHLDG